MESHISCAFQFAPPGVEPVTYLLLVFQEAPNEEKAMGYNISHDGSLVAMAFALGPRNRVWNIGVDVRRIHCPENVLLNDYIESLKHKVSFSHFSRRAAQLTDCLR